MESKKYVLFMVVLFTCLLAFGLPYFILRPNNQAYHDPNIRVSTQEPSATATSSTQRVLTIEAFPTLFLTQPVSPTSRLTAVTLPTLTLSPTITPTHTPSVTPTSTYPSPTFTDRPDPKPTRSIPTNTPSGNSTPTEQAPTNPPVDASPTNPPVDPSPTDPPIIPPVITTLILAATFSQDVYALADDQALNFQAEYQKNGAHLAAEFIANLPEKLIPKPTDRITSHLSQIKSQKLWHNQGDQNVQMPFIRLRHLIRPLVISNYL